MGQINILSTDGTHKAGLSFTGTSDISVDAGNIATKTNPVFTGNGITIPVLASDPSGAVAGQIYYNSTDKVIKIYNTEWKSLVVDQRGKYQNYPFESWDHINEPGAILVENVYWVKFSGMTSAIQVTISPSRSGDGGKNVIRIIQGDSTQVPTTNVWTSLGTLTFRRLIVQRTDETLTGWAVASNPITAGVGTSSSGAGVSSAYSSDLKIILDSYAGGFGIYRNSQVTCNWGNSISGAIGAGYNNSTCATYKWGTGIDGEAIYTNVSGNWSIWIGEN